MASSFSEFPKAILHVDGDAFFVACEVACNPALRGKPVVTGADRRIISAMSYEAKALGVSRGTPIHEIRRNFPQVIIIPSHYKLYEIFSQRLYKIIRRFTPIVEWYSIDECFADLTGLDIELGMPYSELAKKIQDTLISELGIGFSVGLSVSKVLAKVGSKWQKPGGLTIIPLSDIKKYLTGLPLGKVWGIGSQTSSYISQFGITTAQDLVDMGEGWVREHCSRPIVEIWYELCGRSLYDVHVVNRAKHKSFSSTETFMPPTSDPTFIFSEISRHVENVARCARRDGLAGTKVSFFLKTKDFRYRWADCIFAGPTALPGVILSAVQKSFGSIYDPSLVYRATGATLYGLMPLSHVSQDLFVDITEENKKLVSTQKVFSIVDEIIGRYGSNILYLCSSLISMSRRRNREKFFSVPILGKVS